MANDLITRAETMAGMLRMGEPIAFGSDADLIEELASALEAALATILALISEVRALQERVEGAEKALRPFADEADQWEGYSDTENLVEDWPTGPSSSVNVGHLRAARAYFTARTKAGEPHVEG